MKKSKGISFQKVMAIIILSAVCFIGLAQIQPNSLMKEKLSEKISEYKEQKIAECKQQAILEAEIYIDSILHRTMRSPMKDSTDIPFVPTPPADSIEMEIDTNPVIPLLDQSVNQFD